ncbi:MAG: FecR domain-containing protein [Verrucomicrobia bacterium]|nr:FecR domain-containing protein [Verrucomicrobiota bacterium]
MKNFRLPLRAATWTLALALAPLVLSGAALPTPLEESVVTEIVNDVSRITGQITTPAVLRTVVRAPDQVQTGRQSRAELEAADGTITRIGANTRFAFDRASRELQLKQGSVLFHSPTGKGGGKIRSPSASAAVLGTTIIAAATPDGGFKLLVLEGRAQVDFAAGTRLTLAAGPMTFVLPTPGGAGAPGPVVYFDLARQVRASQLVNGFARALPSRARVDQAAAAQRRAVGEGQFVTTGFLMFTATSDTQVSGIEAAGPDSDDRLTGEFTGAQRLALNTPVQLTTPTLPEHRLFRTPLLVPANESAFLNKESDILVTGLLGLSVQIATPTISFSTWSGPREFQFVGRDAITFAGSLRLTDLASVDYVRFFSPRITLPPGATITTDARTTVPPLTLYFDTNETFRLSGGGVNNAAGGLLLQAHAGDVQVENATLSATAAIGETTIIPSAVNLDAPNGAVRLSGSTVNAAGSLFAAHGQTVAIAATTIRAGGDVWLDASTDLTLDRVTLTSSTPATATFQATGNGLLDVRTVGFDAFKEINLGARTLALQDVRFAAGAVVRLVSEQGRLAPNPNTGAAVLTGLVNFVRDVTYAGQPAQNFVSAAAGGAGTQPTAITISRPGP